MKSAPALAALAALALAGCGEKTAPPPPVRPVLSVVVAPETSRASGFAGTVEPQVQASLGFLALGRIVSRAVNVGDAVVKGETLAALDATAFEPAVRSAEADLSSANAQFETAAATEKRQQTLLDQKTASTAQFEAAQQAREAAAAAVARARANLVKAREQLGYTQLKSDFDGVVTAVSAEVGQVVAPGQTVVRVARPDVREAVIDMPDDSAGRLKTGDAFRVALQLDRTVTAAGRVREIAPQADPTTRSRRVRITLDNPPPSFRLGSTITAALPVPEAATIELPASALLETEGRTRVWIVDTAARTVALRDVTVGRRAADRVAIASGLTAGERVVTVGVHSLTPGQSVKIAEETSR